MGMAQKESVLVYTIKIHKMPPGLATYSFERDFSLQMCIPDLNHAVILEIKEDRMVLLSTSFPIYLICFCLTFPLTLTLSTSSR